MQKLQTVNAETLLYEPLEKPSFVVDSLIPTGLSLFCGSQKIGKSWLMLKLCLCVSQGIPLWDMTTMEGVSNYGVYIYQIASGSGAEKGGLKLGDRIISIDDVAVSSASDVQKYCQSKEVGDTVTLQVERDGKVISCEVTLGESTQSTATAESGN